MKLALIQMSMTSNLQKNIDKACTFVQKAAANGAQVILIPELFENLYFCQEKDEKFFNLANEFENHPFISKFQDLAKNLKVVLPVSFFEKHENKYFNSIAMINADGACLGIYRKTFIPSGPYYEEKFYFQSGDTGFKVWNTEYGKIGVGICWDQWFPEAARAMTLQGADLILYPTAIGSEPKEFGVQTQEMWQKVMIGHAIANSVYIGAANRIGQENNISFYGYSFVSDYMGNKIAEQRQNKEDILYAECNLNKAKQFREWMGCISDLSLIRA